MPEKGDYKTGSIIVEGFGLTESTPVTHINPFNGERKLGSIGIPLLNSGSSCPNPMLEKF